LSSLPPADFAALQVLSAALDGSNDSRLPLRLQPQKPAANSKEKAEQVAAQWTARRFAGEMVVLAQTENANATAVREALIDEIKKLQMAPLSPAELQAAKTFSRGQWAVNRESTRERAFQLALPHVWNTFPDTDWPQKIAAVTSSDVQRVAKQYLQSYAVVVIVPGQGSRAE